VGLWGGEEEGELGSLGYIQQHLATVRYSNDPESEKLPLWMQTPVSIVPKAEFNQLDVYFNVDAGGGRFYGIHSEGNLAAVSVFRQWAVPLADLGFQTITVRHMESIDSENFDMVGLPGFEFGQDLRDYDTRTHHTNLDNYERLSEPDLKQAATIMAIFLYNAAQREAMFPRKSLNPVSTSRNPDTQPAPLRAR
jgi:carboxypeptidase Q